MHIQLMISWSGLSIMSMSQYHAEIHFWQRPKNTFLQLNSDMPLFFSSGRSSWKGFHSEQICELVNEKAVWDLVICIFIVWCLSWGEFKLNNKNKKLKPCVSQNVLDKFFNSLICYLLWTFIKFLFQVLYSVTILWGKCVDNYKWLKNWNLFCCCHLWNLS